jgi:hypothetical protein
MPPKDLTVRILEQIRDEARATREEIRATRVDLCERIDQTNARIDQTNARIDRLDGRLERVSTRLEGVEHVMIGMAATQASLVHHIEDRLHADVADLRRRVEVLETKAS